MSTQITLGEKANSELTDIAGRPFIQNPLIFFMDTKASRSMLTICDSGSWKEDLLLAEKLFGNIYISASYDGFSAELQVHKDILKQRKRHPEVESKEEYMRTSKIWILPTKVHECNPPSQLMADFKTDFLPANDLLSVVKVELSGGKERAMIYSMIDGGVLPSLLLVRWSNDVDSHYPTAFCAGHLTNLGYIHVRVTGEYHLYYYTGNNLYDTVSFQEIYLQNPMVQEIIQSVLPLQKPSDIKADAVNTSDETASNCA